MKCSANLFVAAHIMSWRMNVHNLTDSSSEKLLKPLASRIHAGNMNLQVPSNLLTGVPHQHSFTLAKVSEQSASLKDFREE